MNSSAPHPRLPEWPFLLAGLVLLSAAAWLAARGADPLAPPTIVAVAACVGLSAIAALTPFVANQERAKNAALDERQRSLEAIAGTVAAAAEQIGIAAAGLHGIADAAHKSLRQAEQLPHKLQEKIAEFQAQLASTADTEKEELERELLALRTSESERLDQVSQRIAKLTAEWARLESATREQLAALTRELDARTARLDTLARTAAPAVAAIVAGAATPVTAPDSGPEPLPAPESDTSAPAPRRPRKPRRDSGAEAVTEPAPTAAAVAPVTEVRAGEPPPIPVATIAEVTPVAPLTAEPFSGHIASTPPVEPPRKRPAKKDAEPDVPTLGLDLPEAEAASATNERTIASDGATRLIATAYIGIGNRLFIRGEGPGLDWDKGVPLQFVSIGKWRWETNEATAPVRYKLYKNDEIECAALGTQSLDPGHQHEVTAGF
ncbi:MAG: hypothetical protein JNL39_04235 [Opitutaceae bacterium]|nr:hypothetical protein [Opitutaceae bacterium]